MAAPPGIHRGEAVKDWKLVLEYPGSEFMRQGPADVVHFNTHGELYCTCCDRHVVANRQRWVTEHISSTRHIKYAKAAATTHKIDTYGVSTAPTMTMMQGKLKVAAFALAALAALGVAVERLASEDMGAVATAIQHIDLPGGLLAAATTIRESHLPNVQKEINALITKRLLEAGSFALVVDSATTPFNGGTSMFNILASTAHLDSAVLLASSVQHGGTAVDIQKLVTNTLVDFTLPAHMVIGISADGAAVNGAAAKVSWRDEHASLPSRVPAPTHPTRPLSPTPPTPPRSCSTCATFAAPRTRST
jgi:hypothetical protein